VSRPSVTIVETGVANTASVLAAVRRCEGAAGLSCARVDVEGADRLILPGGGAFGAGMAKLRAAGLVEAIRERIEAGRPTMAICLGMQLMCSESEESPGVAGLGIIDAAASAFPEGVRRPQFGWNTIEAEPGCALLRSGCAYFANSYRLTGVPVGWRAATAEHGGRFIAALERGSVLACQFHPELSGAWGASLLGDWLTRTEEALSC